MPDLAITNDSDQPALVRPTDDGGGIVLLGTDSHRVINNGPRPLAVYRKGRLVGRVAPGETGVFE